LLAEANKRRKGKQEENEEKKFRWKRWQERRRGFEGHRFLRMWPVLGELAGPSMAAGVLLPWQLLGGLAQ
jgi:hypothetical protein